MSDVLMISGVTLVTVVLWDEWMRRAAQRRLDKAAEYERVADDAMCAGIRLGAAAERQRIVDALTTDTAEHDAVDNVVDFARPRSVIDAAERFTAQAADDGPDAA